MLCATLSAPNFNEFILVQLLLVFRFYSEIVLKVLFWSDKSGRLVVMQNQDNLKEFLFQGEPEALNTKTHMREFVVLELELKSE